ncbi:MAG: hypothetical protein IJ697_04840 [Synergistaceae bacterium]|nr:hypothetical protein [Synergistaceae bacterium]
MGLFFSVISILCAVIIIPILCVLEYYSGMKMGMYRYFVLKNSWWLKNVFTPEALPVIRILSLLVTVIGIYFAVKTMKRSRSLKTLWTLFGIFVFVANFYVLEAENFAELRTAPFFGLACIAAALFYAVGSFLFLLKAKS